MVDVLTILSVTVIAIATLALGIYAADVSEEKERQKRLDDWWRGRGE